MNQEILAVVAGENITKADVDHFIENMPQEQRAYASNPYFRNHCLDQLVTIRSYAKLGEELKLEETDEFKRIMENARKDLLAQMAIAETLKGIEVTEQEIAAFYEENPHLFKKGDTVSAKHILVKEEDECNAVLASIVSGEQTFEDAAKEKSTCPSGGRGGDLGEFGRGQMVKEFEDAAFEAEIGAVVGPVKTQFGYHLIKVEKKNQASVMPLAEVSEQIRSNLVQQKQNQVYTEKADELKAKYVR
ncbi:MAG: peptidylprolyl isomerase [Lachnospiraceae bacterium]|nr:peptidylprolyl isomerase [Lachnospiraceae bacterium]